MHSQEQMAFKDVGGRAAEESVGATAVAHQCSSCSKRLFVISDHASDDQRCLCGGYLEPASLAPGLYEVRAARRRAASKKAPRSVKQPSTSVPVEADLGYNESHGYGPAHGGPTGPGDAPADPSPDIPPPPEPRDDAPGG
jgi:hypothetical protein